MGRRLGLLTAPHPISKVSEDQMLKILRFRLGNSRSCRGDEAEEVALSDSDFDFSDFDTSASTSLDGSGNYSSPEADSESSLKSPSAATRVDSSVQVIRFGAIGSLKHRVVFSLEGRQVSPWHGLPLHGADGLLHCVCKTPAGTWVQYEVADNEPYNPLRLSQKKGSSQPSKYSENAPWNVCMLPKTYADPDVAVGRPRQDGRGLLRQDGCPLEVIEIGGGVSRRTGEVYLVKLLGALAVVEDGTQLFRWKIIGIAADHRMAAELRAVSDVAVKLPGMLEEIQEWLRTCLSAIAGGGRCFFLYRNLSVAAAAIAEANASWQLYNSELEPLPQLTGVNPQTAENFEKAWHRYTHHLSGVSIPFNGDQTRCSHSLSDRELANVKEKSTPVGEPVGGFMRRGGKVGRRNRLESDRDCKTSKQESSPGEGGPLVRNAKEREVSLNNSGTNSGEVGGSGWGGGEWGQVKDNLGGVRGLDKLSKVVVREEQGGLWNGIPWRSLSEGGGEEEEEGGVSGPGGTNLIHSRVGMDERGGGGGSGARAESCMGAEEEGGSSSEPTRVEEEDSVEVRVGDGDGAAGEGGVEVAQEPSLDVVHADVAKAMLADCDPRGLKDADVADKGGGEGEANATIPAADVAAVPFLTNLRSEAVHTPSQMLHATNLVLTRGHQWGGVADALKMEEARMKQQTRLAMATSDTGGGGRGSNGYFGSGSRPGRGSSLGLPPRPRMRSRPGRPPKDPSRLSDGGGRWLGVEARVYIEVNDDDDDDIPIAEVADEDGFDDGDLFPVVSQRAVYA